MPEGMTTILSRWVSALLLALALAAPAAAPAAAATAQPLTVVELFTSQGCSSCPPADAYLGELATRPDVLALSEHVDYWDYLGWQDKLASPEITRRQKWYAGKFGMSYVYTPQMVVQGMTHATGSDRSTIERLIAEYAKLRRQPVEVETAAGKGFTVVIPAGPANGQAAVWMAVYERRHQIDIGRGENAGRTVDYHNVVHEMKRIGTWNGQALRIPVSATDAEGYDGCAILLQATGSGRILGAARVTR